MIQTVFLNCACGSREAYLFSLVTLHQYCFDQWDFPLECSNFEGKRLLIKMWWWESYECQFSTWDWWNLHLWRVLILLCFLIWWGLIYLLVCLLYFWAVMTILFLVGLNWWNSRFSSCWLWIYLERQNQWSYSLLSLLLWCCVFCVAGIDDSYY